MDSVTALADAPRIELLTQDRAQELAGQLLRMTETWPGTAGTVVACFHRGPRIGNIACWSPWRAPGAWAVVSRTLQSAHLRHIVVAADERSYGVGEQLMVELLRRTWAGVLSLNSASGQRVCNAYHVRPRSHETTPGTKRVPACVSPPGPRGGVGRVKVAVHQPSYAPRSGFFAKLFVSNVSNFSRTSIGKRRDDKQWLTVPSGSPSIDQGRPADSHLAAKHQLTLARTYVDTPHLEEMLDMVAPGYEGADRRLAHFKMHLFPTVAGYLGGDGGFAVSSNRPSGPNADERIADLVSWVGGDTYVSGAGGEPCQDDQTYQERGPKLEVCTYQPREYDPCSWNWVPGLSCLDATIYQGRGARDEMHYADV